MDISFNVIRSIILHCKDVKGAKAKTAAIKYHKDHPGLKEFFKLCLDPSLNYHRRALPVQPFSLKSIYDKHILSHLVQASTARSAALAVSDLNVIARFNLTKAQDWAVNCVLTRKPGCGVGITGCNKIWPGLIREQVYQGCKPDNPAACKNMFMKHSNRNETHACFTEVKYDGMHWICQDGCIRSRQGETVPEPLPDFDWHLDTLCKARGMNPLTSYLAGEALILDSSSSGVRSFLPRKTANPLISNGSSDYCVMLFDMLPTAATAPGVIGTQYHLRRHRLKHAIAVYHDKCMKAGRARVFFSGHFQRTRNWAAAHGLAEKWIASGREGAVHKAPDLQFKPGKQAGVYKDTFSMDVDAVVTGVTKHKVKAGQIGALLCTVPAGESNKEIVFKCGSGLTEAMRTSQADDLTGRVVTITIKDLSKAAGKKPTSVTNPRVADIRSVLKEPDDADAVFGRYLDRTGRRHELDARA